MALGMAGLLLVFLAWPLGEILVKALQGHEGQFVGLRQPAGAAHRAQAAVGGLEQPRPGRRSPRPWWCPRPWCFAYRPGPVQDAVQAACSRSSPSVPLLTPSLMPAISLVYLFGNQGLLKAWMHGVPIYGPLGIVLGECFYTFPYALLVLLTALSISDARLYEAAEVLGANRFRRFITVTVPNIRYGLISACLIVFTLVITDFGVPIVVGGQTNVLALEAYKQVLGQQNFQKGAAVGLVLLLPAVLSFACRALAGPGPGRHLQRQLRGLPRQAQRAAGWAALGPVRGRCRCSCWP